MTILRQSTQEEDQAAAAMWRLLVDLLDETNSMIFSLNEDTDIGERYAVMGKNEQGVIEFAFGGALSAALVRYEQKINKLNVTPDDS